MTHTLLSLLCYILAVVLLVLASLNVGPPRINLALVAAALVVTGWLLIPGWVAV